MHIINKNLDLSQEILFEYIQKFGFNEEVANHLGKICFKYKKFINLEKLITLSIPDASIEIKDLMGDNNHYSATIESKLFNGLSKIDQHKLV